MKINSFLPFWVLTLFITSLCQLGQAQNSDILWDSYVQMYNDDNPGMTVVRLDLNNIAPINGFPFIVGTGLRYKTSREDGLPDQEALNMLSEMSSKLVELLNKHTINLHAGTFIHSNEHLDYFYVDQKDGLQEILENFYAENFSSYKSYSTIEDDEYWNFYKEFLFPDNATLNYLGDKSVVNRLKLDGDDLKKSRIVNHTVYFESEKSSLSFLEKIKPMGFEKNSLEEVNNADGLYKLIISRDDIIELEYIHELANTLRRNALEFNGTYQGWETSLTK